MELIDVAEIDIPAKFDRIESVTVKLTKEEVCFLLAGIGPRTQDAGPSYIRDLYGVKVAECNGTSLYSGLRRAIGL